MRALLGLAALLAASGCMAQPAQAPGRSTTGTPAPDPPAASVTLTVTAAGTNSQGLSALSGADGVTELSTLGGRPCLVNTGGAGAASGYMYFQVADGDSLRTVSPLYVIVQFFDQGDAGPMGLQYDTGQGDTIESRYQPAEDTSGAWYRGTSSWSTAAFRLDHPGFAHRQNLGADFRLQGNHLAIQSVRVVRQRPADWDALNKVDLASIKTLVHIGPGGQLIVGGFDPARVSDAGPLTQQLTAAIPSLKSLGVTSHEVYVRWNLCAPSEGHYDWRVYDAYVAVYKKYHLKWVPFIIFGSAYSLPDWYYKKPGSQGYVCLEHGLASDVQSLWNPVLRAHLARFLQAFCAHYRSSGVIESILLGVSGNYGEAIYPVSGNDWTASVHGDYHSHPGYWAGDPYAIRSFRDWLHHRYGTAAALSRAWGKTIASIDIVKPFLQRDAPNDRAWLDFTEWYIGSMTGYARFWLHTVRHNFPTGDIYLCTGGDAPPEHGSDFGDQCKAAAEVGAGVRITNEGSDYRANFSLTHWVASAGKQYGAYFSFEPAGGVDANGVIARIYNATASGARGLHYYFGNLFGSEAARQNFVRWGSQFVQRHPIDEIGVYYPETYIRLHGNDFLRLVQPLRDRFDFDYRSDQQIADGGLKNIKALILMKGNVAEAGTWRRIAEWVQQGGLLIYPEGMGPLKTVEGGEEFQSLLMGANPRTGRGRVVTYPGNGEQPPYRDFLTHTLAGDSGLSGGTQAMV
ncbi:MAG: family 14 glycosylhydrolase, partial [Chloroflexi bacterium]|nr:family 14 glycosylhydrolase [Chloroflexota bacterium]